MKTVLCFGDSNTHGTCPMRDINDRRRYDRATRWPGALAARLGDRWTVIEEGLPGRTTVNDDAIKGAYKNGERTLLALLESHRPVDRLVIMLGTNDLQVRFSLTPFDIALGVERLLRIAHWSECGPKNGSPPVLLIAPPPVMETGWLAPLFHGAEHRSRELISRLAECADRNGCDFLDAGRIVAASDVDGVHFEPDAHLALAAAVSVALTNP